MRYVLADQDGASRGHFSVFYDLLGVIDEIRSDDADSVGEFCVLKYDDHGVRVGEPVAASHLVPLAAEVVATTVSISSTDGESRAYGAAGAWHAHFSDPLQTA